MQYARGMKYFCPAFSGTRSPSMIAKIRMSPLFLEFVLLCADSHAGYWIFEPGCFFGEGMIFTSHVRHRHRSFGRSPSGPGLMPKIQ